MDDRYVFKKLKIIQVLKEFSVIMESEWLSPLHHKGLKFSTPV